MKKIKRVIIGIIIIVCCVFSNLKSNAIYYAKHMPHKEGSYPELRVLIDNLWWISELEDGTFKYKMDGNSVISKMDTGEQVAYFSNSGYGDDANYRYNDIKNDTYYVFDRKFNLIRVTKGRKYENLLGKIDIDEKKVKEELYAFLKPVVDYQRKPLINLQWLFNWLHQDELN